MSTMRILTAAAFAVLFAVSTASAQQAQRVAGTIDKVEGNTLYIKSASPVLAELIGRRGEDALAPVEKAELGLGGIVAEHHGAGPAVERGARLDL